MLKKFFEMLLLKKARVPPHENINSEPFTKGKIPKIIIASPGGTRAIEVKECTAKHQIP